MNKQTNILYPKNIPFISALYLTWECQRSWQVKSGPEGFSLQLPQCGQHTGVNITTTLHPQQQSKTKNSGASKNSVNCWLHQLSTSGSHGKELQAGSGGGLSGSWKVLQAEWPTSMSQTHPIGHLFETADLTNRKKASSNVEDPAHSPRKLF